MRRTPLAWLNLTHAPRRLLLAAAGVGVAMLLMCVELSIYGALLENSVAVIEHLQGELFIVSKARYSIAVKETFSHRRLAQARSCPAVAGASPLYIETHRSNFKCPNEGKADSPPIRVLAFNPDEPVFNFPRVEQCRVELRLPRRALFDRRSKTEEYGDIVKGRRIEVAGRRLTVIDFFSLGSDFANDGNLITSDLTFRRLFPLPGGVDPLDLVDVGVVRLKSTRKRDILAAQRQLVELFPQNAAGEPADVRVLTKHEFIEREKNFWKHSTPIGFVFRLGVAMGFVVGLVLCYQVLSSDVHDHLRQFATLKAMGYANGYFVFVVFLESLILSLFGFFWSVPLSVVLGKVLGHLTHLQVRVTWATALMVLVMGAAMCACSGCLAVRRVMRLNPAELF
ncbi:MAG TPA: ABC transporter permease DevC [Pirellulales bacterium]